MGVTRYRSVADMPDEQPALDAASAMRSACELGRLGLASSSPLPRGVTRYRSVEEAAAARRAAEEIPDTPAEQPSGGGA